MHKPYPEVDKYLLSALAVFLTVFLESCSSIRVLNLEHPVPPCTNPGWYPDEFGIKDHTLFWHDGYSYLASIYVPEGQRDPLLQDRFAYARSKDLCDWEVLPFILDERIPGSWDEVAVWAPFVYEVDGIYYLFYTGVQKEGTQSILLAKSSNPAHPESWKTTGMVIQPDHEGMIWQPDSWADFRDPYILKIEDTYHLLYSARDQGGPVIGMATAMSIEGPWKDHGSILTGEGNAMLESPVLVPYSNYYYLFYNLSGVGGQYRISSNPAGPWSKPFSFSPGWAHEIWQDQQNNWFTSYLTDYSVSIRPLIWDEQQDPPNPKIIELDPYK